MQIKMTMKYNLIFIRITVMQKITIVDKDMEKFKPL